MLTCLTFFGVHIAEGSQIQQASCTCTIRQSQKCGHTCELLYTLAPWNKQGRHSVPFDIANTSWPQTGHVPRDSNKLPTTVDDVEVHKPTHSCDSKVIKSTLYDPTNGAQPDWQIFQEKLLDNFPTILALPAIHNAISAPPVVPTKFCFVPEGYILSYQQKQHTFMAISLVGIVFPEVPVQNIMVNNYCTVLTRTAATPLDSLSTSVVESQAFEKLARD